MPAVAASATARIGAYLRGQQETRRRVIEALLLYDKLLVPTQDHMAVVAMLQDLGEAAVRELLEDGSLGFIRLNSGIAYGGNGVGLQAINIERKEGTSVFGGPAEDNLRRFLASPEKLDDFRALVDAVEASTVELEVSPLLNGLRDETYKVAANSALFSSVLRLAGAHTNRFPGISDDQVRLFAGGPNGVNWRGDGIDSLLHMAHANLLVRVLGDIDGTELISDAPLSWILDAKATAERAAYGKDVLRVLERVASVPDVSAQVLAGSGDSLRRILRLRRSRNGHEFRRWVHENQGAEDLAIAKSYAQLVDLSLGAHSEKRMAVWRTLLAFLIGLLSPVGGLAAGLVDAVAPPRWTGPPSARYFIADLRDLGEAARNGKRPKKRHRRPKFGRRPS